MVVAAFGAGRMAAAPVAVADMVSAVVDYIADLFVEDMMEEYLIEAYID